MAPRRRPLASSCLAVLLTAAAFLAAVPSAEAHSCSSSQPGGCGPCTAGEEHQHDEPGYHCQSFCPPGNLVDRLLCLVRSLT